MTCDSSCGIRCSVVGACAVVCAHVAWRAVYRKRADALDVGPSRRAAALTCWRTLMYRL